MNYSRGGGGDPWLIRRCWIKYSTSWCVLIHHIYMNLYNQNKLNLLKSQYLPYIVHSRYKWIHIILFYDFQVVTRRVWTMNLPHVKMSFFLLNHMLTLKSVFFSYLHQLFYTFKSSWTSACYFSSKSPGHFICWSKINQAVLFTK